MGLEIWKDIPRLKELAQISNKGRFKYLAKSWICGKGRVDSHPDIITLGSIDSRGYYQVCVYRNKRNKMYLVHRLVAKAFIPNPKRKKTVNHKDGDKLNNNDWNLEWNTYSENQTHSYKLGLKKSNGENNGNSKLTKKEVLKIRKLRPSNSLKVLAKKYNVTLVAISNICTNKTWKNIK